MLEIERERNTDRERKPKRDTKNQKTEREVDRVIYKERKRKTEKGGGIDCLHKIDIENNLHRTSTSTWVDPSPSR